ncbi:glycosyltransferase family 1 protein [Rhizobium sp. BK060]|uniref:glycosyltransferase family 4 protein n=1 Tax=Rhizobium sp. BK060 TaxID=2587096 RepID=UPI00160AE4DF|nr:glycosyltransferase family 1 protein [Rhizobium sp. BK060]MBB3397902.1 glycosyltransferase involved in cell wall biosynthesis [Rhizobium sp. BK060]
MRLWIDGQCFQTASRKRGIGRYVQELILGIVDNHPDVELLVSLNAAMPLEALAARDHLQQWVKPANIFMWHGIAEGGEAIRGYTERRQLSEQALAYHVACLRPDIALSASPFEGFGDKAVQLSPNDISGIPIASIFYDAIPYRHPQHYLASPAARNYYNRRLALYSEYDLNLCISEYSQNECIEISKNPRAVNILAGVSKDFEDALKHVDAKSPRPTEKRFVLYVGGLDWRKNIESAIEAFALLPTHLREQYSFVLAGDHPNALLQYEEERWKKLGLAERDFVAVGHVTDSELASLYKMTDLVIQPSLLEGFGLTALEAMTCGAPVIASNTGALPEVVGDKELLFNPADVKDMAEVMKRALSNPDATKASAETRRIRAAEFSWAKSACIAVSALRQTADRMQAPSNAGTILTAQRGVLENLADTRLPDRLLAETLARSEITNSTGRRLIVDATSTYRVDHKTGIQRVVKNICANLGTPEQGDGVERLVAYSDSSDGWFGIPKTLEKAIGSNVFTDDTRLEFSSHDRILMLDSSWEFYQDHYWTLLCARLRGAAVISCLYDMVPLKYPGMCHPGMPRSFSAWFQKALSYSTSFVCISKAVADELIATLEAIEFPRPMKIGYWHLGADFSQGSVEASVGSAVANAPPAFIMVGTLEPRKGHTVALEAFETLWSDGIDVKLTIVGKPGWGVEGLIQRIERHAEFGKRLFWCNGISDEELQKAYAESNALIAASYAEGFGLPIVEAAHLGKSVIASDIPVFREVAERGQDCRFFTTGSSPALAKAIRSFLRANSNMTPNVQGESSTVGTIRHSMSWKESANELQRIVLTDDWYKIYKPRTDKTYVPISDIGNTKVDAPLHSSETRHEITLVEGPVAVNGNRTLKYMVRITNRSAKVWASASSNHPSLAVMISYRILSKDGNTIFANKPGLPIPFVLPPGDSLYMSIEVPSKFKDKRGAFADIGLVQEAVGWWSNPLRVAL